MKIENAPSLFMGLELFWEAYADLSTCRPVSFGGPLPIPWSAIRDYAEAHDFDEEQAETLELLVRRMDSEFLKWHEAKYGSQSKPEGIRNADAGRSPWRSD